MKHTGTIEAISHKFDKFAILHEEKWYNTKKEYAAEWPVQPAVGDEISWDDGGKKYLGKMKIVKKNSAAPAGGMSNPPAGGGYSNIGVEIGHASKLAMDIALQQAQIGMYEVGSTDFYKAWAKETLKVHGFMTKLKAKAANTPAPVVETVPEEPAEEAPVIMTKASPDPVEVADDDIF
tara:strand:+ start:212 stop:745 length:534 start_codon:yes stop_codon:yes gene_type:complete